MNISEYLKEKIEFVDKTLAGIIPYEDAFPQNLHKAIRYSIFAGGKRIRPVLLIASAESVGGRQEDVINAACAIELIHTYSLIHDDLPAMDNDDLRRGKAANHKVFGEAMAILAGDALLTLAFDVLAQYTGKDSRKMLTVIHEIAKASGAAGMVGGQVVDMESEGRECGFPILEYIHTHKTGALILASIRAGAILSDASSRQIEQLARYGEAVGLAFQIADDILDIEGSKETMGKNTGSDIKKDKITYPKVIGLKESKERVRELVNIALDSIKDFDDKAEPLRKIAGYVVERKG
ncbi:MAG: polyprenyl synthetase family protein [Deltaproteobacteria bacterium]|nr:polyprenyl synthetase family protein [Deltaproteobacteria bacterium]